MKTGVKGQQQICVSLCVHGGLGRDFLKGQQLPQIHTHMPSLEHRGGCCVRMWAGEIKRMAVPLASYL